MLGTELSIGLDSILYSLIHDGLIQDGGIRDGERKYQSMVYMVVLYGLVIGEWVLPGWPCRAGLAGLALPGMGQSNYLPLNPYLSILYRLAVRTK